MKLPVVSLILVAAISMAMAQNKSKPGSCPPALPTQFCGRSCYVDDHCSGIGKCCETQCGGTICTMPVTSQTAQVEKPGSCPSIPTGRWVCTSTCSGDSDCRGDLKCCRNRCGAQACQRAVIQAEESPDDVNSRYLYDRK